MYRAGDVDPDEEKGRGLTVCVRCELLWARIDYRQLYYVRRTPYASTHK